MYNIIYHILYIGDYLNAIDIMSIESLTIVRGISYCKCYKLKKKKAEVTVKGVKIKV